MSQTQDEAAAAAREAERERIRKMQYYLEPDLDDLEPFTKPQSQKWIEETLAESVHKLEKLSDRLRRRGELEFQLRCLNRLLDHALLTADPNDRIHRYLRHLRELARRAKKFGEMEKIETDLYRWEELERRALEKHMDVAYILDPILKAELEKKPRKAKQAAKTTSYRKPLVDHTPPPPPPPERDWSQVPDEELEKEMGRG